MFLARTTSLLGVVLVSAVMSAGVLTAQGTATTICKDKTTSAASGRGACSRHGGIDEVATKASRAEARTKAAAARAERKMKTAGGEVERKAGETKNAIVRKSGETKNAVVRRARGEDNDPAGAIAQCRDGMYSHATTTRGACSRHGGIAKKL